MHTNEVDGNDATGFGLTGFANDATPFIRYRIGDVGTRSKRPCSCGRPGEVFLDVDGRIEDYVVTPDGRWIGRMDHVFKEQLEIAEALQHLRIEVLQIFFGFFLGLGYWLFYCRRLGLRRSSRLGLYFFGDVELFIEVLLLCLSSSGSPISSLLAIRCTAAARGPGLLLRCRRPRAPSGSCMTP